jgi:aspartate-semialdehyde dehydrogenase
MSNTRQPLRAGILGATGAVGQRFITLLANHPGFVIQRLGASARSAGRRYEEAVTWRMATPLPASVASLVVVECKPEAFNDCDVIFSGLDASVAGDIELSFLAADHCVISNAKNHRMADDVPLVVPTVNPEHLHMIPAQRLRRNLKRGFLVTISNCASVGVCAALQALKAKQSVLGKVDRVNVVTMQAISGAGYPGMSAMDMLDNVVPYIGGEEEKLEAEPFKILGTPHTTVQQVKDQVANGKVAEARKLATAHQGALIEPLKDFVISATCNRVPVIDGHMASMSVGFARDAKQANMNKETMLATVKEAFAQYETLASSKALGCVSAPHPPIHLLDAVDRPQPRLDRDRGNGYAVTIGRVRPCPL